MQSHTILYQFSNLLDSRIRLFKFFASFLYSDGGGSVMCLAFRLHPFQESPSDDSLMAAQREAVREKHGGRQLRERCRTEAEHGPPGTTGSRPKPVASSRRGFMCTLARRNNKEVSLFNYHHRRHHHHHRYHHLLRGHCVHHYQFHQVPSRCVTLRRGPLYNGADFEGP